MTVANTSMFKQQMIYTRTQWWYDLRLVKSIGKSSMALSSYLVFIAVDESDSAEI